MKTVFNWTVGSFFRSIGRIVAYVFIGCLIAYLLNRSGFDWGRLLGIEKVNASEIVNGQEWHSLYTDSTLSTQLTYTNSYGIRTVSTNSNSITSVDYWFNNPITKDNNRDYISFGIMLLGETYNNNVGSNDILVCDDWSNYNDSTGSGYFCKSFVDSNSVINTTTPISFKFNIWLRTSTGDSTQCTVTNGFVMCPLIKNYTYTYIRVDYNYSLGQSQVLRFGINRLFTRYINDTGQITNAIDQQTQQQQQQYNDTNSTSESNTATSYFNNQQDDTPSALTSAITSPLRIIDNAIQGTHNPLCFTLNSKQTCIPSGDIIWQNYDTSNSRHHWFDSSFVGGGGSAVSKFQQFFNIVVAGYLCYKMLLSMMRIFNDSVDPTVSRIEVMKL